MATTERLLEAAELAFGDEGYHGAKLAQIAARAGISRPSLLYHFQSKEGLYEAVVTRVFAQLGAALQTSMAAPDADFEARIDALVDAFVGFVSGRPAVARLVLRELMQDDGPGHALILNQGLPLIELVEAYVRAEGGERFAPDFPIRGALMQVVSTAFVKAASGALEAPLWGPQEPHKALARQLFSGAR